MVTAKADLLDSEFEPCPRAKGPAARWSLRRLRGRFVDIAVVIATCGVLAGLILPPRQNYDRTISLPPPSGRTPDPEVAKIAGEYHRIGWSLNVLPDGRYSFVCSGCLGVYEKDRGYARLVDGHLKLFPILPRLEPKQSGDTWLRRLPTGLVPVRWGNRRYLISDEQAADFGEAIRRGWEPRPGYRGGYFLNAANVEDPVDGLPDVPDRWKKWLPERRPEAVE